MTIMIIMIVIFVLLQGSSVSNFPAENSVGQELRCVLDEMKDLIQKQQDKQHKPNR